MVSPCTTTEKTTTPKAVIRISLPNKPFPLFHLTRPRLSYTLLYDVTDGAGEIQGDGMAGFFTSFRFKAILTLIVACVLTALYSYFIAGHDRDEDNRRPDDEGGRKIHDRDEDRLFVKILVPIQVRFRHGPERCDQAEGEGGQIKKYGWRMPFTHQTRTS